MIADFLLCMGLIFRFICHIREKHAAVVLFKMKLKIYHILSDYNINFGHHLVTGSFRDDTFSVASRK